jgi:hypothetical protein
MIVAWVGRGQANAIDSMDIFPQNILSLESFIRERETRTNGLEYYNYACRTKRFSQSPIIYAINKYNLTLYNS